VGPTARSDQDWSQKACAARACAGGEDWSGGEVVVAWTALSGMLVRREQAARWRGLGRGD
jgi:hypothetical protein